MQKTGEIRDPFERAVRTFGRFPENVVLRVYRYSNFTGRYLGRVDWNPDAHDENWLRARWGPGGYQLRFETRGRRKRRFSQVVRLGCLPTTEKAPSASVSSRGLATSTPTVSAGELRKGNIDAWVRYFVHEQEKHQETLYQMALAILTGKDGASPTEEE